MKIIKGIEISKRNLERAKKSRSKKVREVALDWERANPKGYQVVEGRMCIFWYMEADFADLRKVSKKNLRRQLIAPFKFCGLGS